MAKLIDTHSHINFNAYKDDAGEVITRSFDAGVHMIAVGSQIDTSARAVHYATQYKTGVWAAVGLHPIHLEEVEVDEHEVQFKSRKEIFNYDVYKRLAQDEKVVAIGECGLDYYRIDDMPADNDFLQNQQKKVFKEQLKLAEELDLPVIIHCREAYDDLLNIVQEFIAEGHHTPRASMHCYIGDLAMARKFLKLGFYISFTGIITFSKVEQLLEVVRKVPLEKILVETDCPYLTPVPHRGKRNEPAYVRFVAEKIAELKGVSFEAVAEQTTQNARTLFSLI